MIILFAFVYPFIQREAQAYELYFKMKKTNPNVYPILCEVGKYDYQSGLKQFWGYDDILIIEGDKILTEDDIYEIIKCPHPDCCCKFKMYPHKTGHAKPIFAQRIVKETDNGKILKADFIEGNEEFCDLTGLGCTKISLVTQELVRNELFKIPRRDPDHVISIIAFSHGVKWHIHDEIGHNDYGDWPHD